jgi:tetrapyrrole methylase family protein/MazG family protein
MVGKPHVVVVGLGPAGADLLLPAARAALARVPIRFVRTARHPAVDDLARDGIDLEPLDLLYDQADDLDTVYAAIADRVVETAREHGEIVYAVPGSPTIAERSVELVRAAGIDVELIPGISFVDLAWWRLGIDPMHGARVVDARAFAIDAAGSIGPMLIAQCDSQLVCSEVKLALLESLPPEHDITVLQRLGLADERLFTVALADLDRVVEPDHLTSLFVDTGDTAVGPELARLVALTERLRGPGGCPWDAAQTHHSLRRHVLEEAYEVVEAIEALPADAPSGDIPIGAYDALEDELGDLLFQVMIQSVLASEAGAFTVADVARAVHAKLVRRHPHVFGDVVVRDASEVVTNWEQIKKTEHDDQSLVAGVTAGLPALIAAQKLFRKGASIGLEPDLDLGDAVRHLVDGNGTDLESALGVALASIVAIGRTHDIDAESALASWGRRYKDQFRRMEQLASETDVDLTTVSTAQVRDLWVRAAATP